MGERSATSARLRASCVFRARCPRGDSRPSAVHRSDAPQSRSDETLASPARLDSQGGFPHVGCGTRRSVALLNKALLNKALLNRWGHPYAVRGL